MSVVTWWHLNTTYALEWRTPSEDSLWRDAYATRFDECNYPGWEYCESLHAPPCRPSRNMSHPLQVLRGGGGRFYNMHNDERDYQYNGAEYRHLLITDSTRNTGRARFYQPCFTHALSESNAEIRSVSSGVDLFGMSNEGNTCALKVSHSRDIFVSAFTSGFSTAFPHTFANFSWPPHFNATRIGTPGMFRIDAHSSGITMANLIDFGGDDPATVDPDGGPTTWTAGDCCDWPFPEPRPARFVGAYWWPWDGKKWGYKTWSVVSFGAGGLTGAGERPVLFKL
jgi:hypothetical protein